MPKKETVKPPRKETKTKLRKEEKEKELKMQKAELAKAKKLEKEKRKEQRRLAELKEQQRVDKIHNDYEKFKTTMPISEQFKELTDYIDFKFEQLEMGIANELHEIDGRLGNIEDELGDSELSSES